MHGVDLRYYKSMYKKFRALALHQKIFIGLTSLLFVALILLYSANLHSALMMDKDSYNCTQDSMMKIICDDPYGSSVTWTLITLVVIGWPLVAAWLISGLVILLRLAQIRFISSRNKNNG